ncbi:pituitary tumor-transforming gene 1 protein-interacting protein-like isoform X1 [Engystomops pustulosus]|uniref:pituitary tumor-transforming gene 1 protein-interacting protein-like isoform X1 n=1 Tax=Engystomops pustulosus TaxID=76066 RepID=UPI003AFB4659
MEEMRAQHHCARALLLLLGLAMVASQTSPPVPAPITRPCSFYSGKSCEECLRNVSCLWCLTNNTCLEYPVRSILPPPSLCAMSAARWGACWINFEALIIAMAVVAGVMLLAVIICCCYCCYCRKSSSSRLRLEAEEENLIREREKRKQESLQRKNERTIKHNEIRKKYGLLQDMDHPYSKFDNE